MAHGLGGIPALKTEVPITKGAGKEKLPSHTSRSVIALWD